jgi:hypothetical protein
MEDGPTSTSAEACAPPTLQMQYFCGHDSECLVEPEQLTNDLTRNELLGRVRIRCEDRFGSMALR